MPYSLSGSYLFFLLVYQGLKKTLVAGCSKTLRYKAPETPRSESYSPVRRNDEG